jgi:hypothetical protein
MHPSGAPSSSQHLHTCAVSNPSPGPRDINTNVAPPRAVPSNRVSQVHPFVCNSKEDAAAATSCGESGGDGLDALFPCRSARGRLTRIQRQARAIFGYLLANQRRGDPITLESVIRCGQLPWALALLMFWCGHVSPARPAPPGGLVARSTPSTPVAGNACDGCRSPHKEGAAHRRMPAFSSASTGARCIFRRINVSTSKGGQAPTNISRQS